MKAWVLSDRTGDCEYCSLVFADNRNEAKKQANYSNGYMYSTDLEIDEWINISAKRAKELDDMENASEKEICLKLMTEYSFWFEIGGTRYYEDDIEEFEQLWS